MPKKKKTNLVSYAEAASFCPHPPGSTGKILILEARLAYGIELYHPGDNQIPIIPKDKRAIAAGEVESPPDAEIHLGDDDD